MKRTIVAIVGESGSGKTFASFHLQQVLGWNPIVSYTTRPMREGETNGREHWFVTDKEIPEKSKMCAYTVFGNHQYWTEWGQFDNNKTNIYVIDEKGLVDLRAKEQTPFPFNLFTIKINRKNKEGIDKARTDRDKERVTIPDNLYDYVINNDETIEAFRAALYLIGKCIEHKCNGSTNK